MLRVAWYFSAKFKDTDTNNQRFLILKEVCPNRIETRFQVTDVLHYDTIKSLS